jgi:hypothetical protein
MRTSLKTTLGVLAAIAITTVTGCEFLGQLFGGQDIKIRVEYVTADNAYVFDGSTVEFGEVEFDSFVDGTFRVVNEGDDAFEVGGIECNSYAGGNGFQIVSSYTGELGPGESKEFTIRFAPTSGSEGYGATIEIDVRDEDARFSFNVSGTGYSPTVYEPSMEVYDLTWTPLESGISQIYMGAYTTGGVATTVGLPVANVGNATLTILEVVEDPTGSIVYVLNSYSLEPDEQTTLDVTAKTDTLGSPVTSTITITSNDPAGGGEFVILFYWFVAAP